MSTKASAEVQSYVWRYHEPAVEADAESQVEGGNPQQSPEALQQQGDQAHLEHVGVEHQQENDDHVEQDGDVLDAGITFQSICYGEYYIEGKNKLYPGCFEAFGHQMAVIYCNLAMS